MTFAIVRSEKSLTRGQVLKRFESPGRPVRRVAGGWIDDLVSLRKAITLCFACARKFDPEAGRYHKIWHAGMNYVIARCDGCREPRMKCNLYQPLEQSPHAK